MISQSCPICKAVAKFYCDKAPVHYFKCQSCRTIFQYPLPSVEMMVNYANQEYRDGVYKEYVQAREIKYATFRNRLADIQKRVEGRYFLDIGCSCGCFIDVALEQGLDVYGVEFSSVAIAAATERARSRITQGDVNLLSNKYVKTFDVITVFDVIEHTLEPIQFLKILRTMLKPKGLLVITTPNTDHFLRSLMGKHWPMLQPFQHVVLFSEKSLYLALKETGYKDIELMPAKKVLTADYLAEQVRIHTPLITQGYKILSKIFPVKILNKAIPLNIGEVMAFARFDSGS